jgi:hypothetical protein
MGQAPVRLLDGKTYHLIVDFAILHYVDQIRVVLSTRPRSLLISSIFEVSTLLKTNNTTLIPPKSFPV